MPHAASSAVPSCPYVPVWHSGIPRAAGHVVDVQRPCACALLLQDEETCRYEAPESVVEEEEKLRLQREKETRQALKVRLLHALASPISGTCPILSRSSSAAATTPDGRQQCVPLHSIAW